MARRYARLKRAVVFLEVLFGSLATAIAFSLFFQLASGELALTGAELDERVRAVLVLLIAGLVLFADGLRRGRLWW